MRLKGILLDDEKLCSLAVAVRSNAEHLLADARVLLDAGRCARAHALGVLALEELGKIIIFLEGLFGSLSHDQVLAAWDAHAEKLMRGHQLALLYVGRYPATDVIRRLQKAVAADAAAKLQGFYVDPTPVGISVPDVITPEEATELIELVESVLQVAQAMALDTAPELYRSSESDAGRRFMREVEESLRNRVWLLWRDVGMAVTCRFRRV